MIIEKHAKSYKSLTLIIISQNTQSVGTDQQSLVSK